MLTYHMRFTFEQIFHEDKFSFFMRLESHVLVTFAASVCANADLAGLCPIRSAVMLI